MYIKSYKKINISTPPEGRKRGSKLSLCFYDFLLIVLISSTIIFTPFYHNSYAEENVKSYALSISECIKQITEKHNLSRDFQRILNYLVKKALKDSSYSKDLKILKYRCEYEKLKGVKNEKKGKKGS